MQTKLRETALLDPPKSAATRKNWTNRSDEQTSETANYPK
jgi:hypothetical protein